MLLLVIKHLWQIIEKIEKSPRSMNHVSWQAIQLDLSFHHTVRRTGYLKILLHEQHSVEMSHLAGNVAGQHYIFGHLATPDVNFLRVLGINLTE